MIRVRVRVRVTIAVGWVMILVTTATMYICMFIYTYICSQAEEITDEEVRDVLQGKFSELAGAFMKMDKSGDGKLQIRE